MPESNKLKNKKIDRSQIPIPGEPRTFHFPEFHRFNLENGLEVIVAPQRQLPLVSLNFSIKSSTLIDPPGKEGLANLVSETIFEGTKKYKSTEIANQLEMLGTHYGAQTDWNSINVELNVLKKNLIPALDIYTDVIRRAIFPDHEFKRVKKELIVDRMRVPDNPAKLCNEFLIKQIYDDFRYGFPVEGTFKSLNGINRKDVQKFYKTFYVPNNSALIIVGDISLPKVEDIVKNYFASWPEASAFTLPKSKTTLPEKRRISLIHKPGSAQSELRIGHLGMDRKNPDYYAVTLLNEIFGGYFLSRINMNLREEHGYTYGASSIFSSRKLKGPFIIAASIQDEFILEAINEVIGEIERIKAEQVSDEEIENAKGFLNGVFPVAFETADQIAMGLANIIVFDLPNNYYRTFKDNIAGISKIDILEAAKKYLHPNKMDIVVTGDRTKIEKFIDKLGEVNIYDVEGQRIK